MLSALKSRLKKNGFVKKAIETPVDLETFKKEPSGRFLCGLSVVAFSYIIAWPLISILGILAIYLKEPLVFVIGSPSVMQHPMLFFCWEFLLRAKMWSNI